MRINASKNWQSKFNRGKRTWKRDSNSRHLPPMAIKIYSRKTNLETRF